MTTIADIRLLSQRKSRGTYPIHPNAIGDNGAVTAAVPDDYEVRVLHFTRHDSAERPTVVETVSVETLRQLQLSPDGKTGIGITDDDFYIFNNGRKTRFLTDRRLAYHSVALSAVSRFAFVASDLLLHGYSVGLGDSGNRLLWTKDLQQPTELVAISPSGKYIATIGTAGEVLVLSDSRDITTTIHTALYPISICIDNDGNVAVVGRDMVDNLVKAKVVDATGDYRFVADVDGEPTGIAILSGGDIVAVPITSDAKSGKILFVTADGSLDAWEVLIDNGSPTGIAASPCGLYLSVTTKDGAIYRFEVDSVANHSDSATDAYSAFMKRLAEDEVVNGTLDFCSRWLGNQSADFADVASRVGEQLLTFLANMSLQDYSSILKDLSARPHCFLLPQVIQTAFCVSAQIHIQNSVATLPSTIEEQLELLAGIQSIMRVLVIDQVTANSVGAIQADIGEHVLTAMSNAIALGNLDRAAQLAVLATNSGIENTQVLELHRKVNLERTLQDANVRYDAKDYSGALFGYRKVLRWMPDNREIRARIQFAEAMVTDSGLHDRFSRLE